MIDLGRGIPIYRATIDRMLIGEPDSLLIVEFHGDADAPLMAKLGELETLMRDLGYPDVVRATDGAFQADIASVREAGLNIMMSMKGDAKPVSFIEDCAVDLDDLADYTERLNDVFARHGTKGTWYAHASVGCLHVRPVLNMKDAVDVRTMRTVAEECFALVRDYKGSHSGEHGDGLARSEFNEVMFGSRIARAFEGVKDAFDPNGMLNPGRVVRPPRMDDRTLFRYPEGYGAVGFTPRLDWSDHPGALLGAVEMCNNNGTCRAFDAGVMCPSYRVTRDEEHLTRGRANTLRLALTGQLGADAMASDEVAQAMALCVSCKACRRECPTGVDMAKMKIEVLGERAERLGLSRGDRLIGALPRIAPFAARLAPLSNLRNRSPRLRSWAENASASRRRAPCPSGGGISFATRRLGPLWCRSYVARCCCSPIRSTAGSSRRICARRCACWRRQDIARTYRPCAAGGSAAAARCFRSGRIDAARAQARRMVAALAGDAPIIGLEPSCLLTLRDEYPALLPGEASGVAERALLIGEFLDRLDHPLPLRPVNATAHVHGHCHQKSFAAFAPALRVLNRIPGLTAKPIVSSCCGMAGTFGYQADTQEVSRAMAEASLLPAVRAAAAEDIIVADGTSCRHQIRDLANRQAVHAVQVLARALPA